MADLTRLPHGLDAAARACRAVIETPKGRRSKYDYDPESGLFRLHSLLPEGMSFPSDFGFIPSTLAEDGDPEDIMVLADEPSPVGVLVEARLLGVIETEKAAEGRKMRNDRIVAAPAISRLHAQVRALGDLGQAYVDDLARFWVDKGRIEGKPVRVLGVGGPDRAVKLIETAAAAADRSRKG